MQVELSTMMMNKYVYIYIYFNLNILFDVFLNYII